MARAPGALMRAVVWDGSAVRVTDRAAPEATDTMAVVRVAVAGICNTDLELLAGYMGFRGVLGHEFTGTVVAGPSAWRGRRVVGEINFACEQCERCRRGLRRHCAGRQVMGILGAAGAFAEMVAVPVANLHAVPDGVPDEAAVFTEPLAAAFEILAQVDVVPGTAAVVLGDGKLGLLVAQVLHRAGACVRAVGRHEHKLAILRRRGIDAVTEAQWDRSPADLVVESTGSAAGLQLAVSATRPRGILVLKSTVAGETTADLAPLVINEITVIGSRCGAFPPALRALETDSVDVRSLIAARFPLAGAVEAFRRAGGTGVLKVLLVNE